MIENISVQEAITLFQNQWQPQSTEVIPLEEANTRILGDTLYAKESIPVVRASMMDGIAIKGDNYTKDPSHWVYGKDYIRADTGDDFSDDFDTVIAIEKVAMENGKLSWKEDFPFEKGMNVKPRGSIIKEHTLLLEKGSRINATALALLAMGNHGEVTVYKKPKVVFIPTGSELVDAGTKLSRGENINSNGPMARVLLEEFGAVPILYPITKDNPESLRIAMEKALKEGDMVLINGGSSKGEEDFNLRLLEKMGEVYFHWTQCGPGRPAAMAKIKNKPVFIVPGPAYGCFNVMQWLIGPCIRYLTGAQEPCYYKVRAKLKAPIQAPTHFQFLLGAQVERNEEGNLLVTLLSFKKHGVPACLKANGFVHTKPGMNPFQVGDEIEVNLLMPV